MSIQKTGLTISATTVSTARRIGNRLRSTVSNYIERLGERSADPWTFDTYEANPFD